MGVATDGMACYLKPTAVPPRVIPVTGRRAYDTGFLVRATETAVRKPAWALGDRRVVPYLFCGCGLRPEFPNQPAPVPSQAVRFVYFSLVVRQTFFPTAIVGQSLPERAIFTILPDFFSSYTWQMLRRGESSELNTWKGQAET